MERYPGSIAPCDDSAQTSQTDGQTDGLASWHKREMYITSRAKNYTERLWCERAFICCSIGSWSYDGNNVKLQVEDSQGPDGLDITYYKSSCPLAVESHKAEIVTSTYPCCEEPYPSMDISITYSRRQ